MSNFIVASSVFARLRYSCKYPSCKNAYYHLTGSNYTNKKFHRFPINPDSLKIWQNDCNVPSHTINSKNLTTKTDLIMPVIMI